MPDVLSSPVVVDVVSSVVGELVEASPEVDVLELDSEPDVSVEEDDEELVPWSASMLRPGFAASYAFSSSRDSLPLPSLSMSE